MKPFDMPSEPRIAEMAWPTRVILGAGALRQLGGVVEQLKMKRPLVVTDPGVVKSGIAQRIYDLLEETHVRYSRYEEVQPNPTERDAEQGLAAFQRGDCDGIIAVGGGSSLDAAKLVQLLTTHEPPLSRYDDAAGGDKFVKDNMPPLIAIPTTAGTGSEVGRAGVVTLPDTGRKTVIFSPFLLPKVALCDPELTVGLPPHLTAATGMDALTHCIEAYVAGGFHPLADAVALDGINRVSRSLPVAFAEPSNLFARTDMMVAAMQGAMAFQKGLGACHALAHALTPVSGLHHGLANAICLPTVMAFNRSNCTARLARISVALGDDSMHREEVRAESAIDRVRKLNELLGIPSRLRDAGVREEDLPEIARKGFLDASHRTNPRQCSEAELLDLVRAAF